MQKGVMVKQVEAALSLDAVSGPLYLSKLGFPHYAVSSRYSECLHSG